MLESNRQLRAVVYSDISGYSALTNTNEAEGTRLVRAQREAFQPIVSQYGGDWIREKGDGLLLSFGSIEHAVRCAIDIQHAAKSIENLKLRISVHAGDVELDSSDIFGNSVNICARMEPLAPDGGIVFSEFVYQSIKGKGLSAEELDEFQFKGITEKIRVYYLVHAGIPVPDLEKVTGNAKTELLRNNETRVSPWYSSRRLGFVAVPLILLAGYLNFGTFTREVLLTGTVHDPAGVPIRGAQVLVDGYNFRAETRSDGRFTRVLTGVSDDEIITLRISHRRFKSYSVDAAIDSTAESVSIVLESRDE